MSHRLKHFDAQFAAEVFMLPMRFDVSGVSAFLRERFVASLASVRSLSGVKAHVNLHRFLFRKFPSAKFAFVIFHMKMTPYVAAQVLAGREFLVTNRTIVVRFFTVKAQDVIAQIIFRRQNFSANLAVVTRHRIGIYLFPLSVRMRMNADGDMQVASSAVFERFRALGALKRVRIGSRSIFTTDSIAHAFENVRL